MEKREESVLSEEELRLIVQAFINTNVWVRKNFKISDQQTLRSQLTVDGVIEKLKPRIEENKEMFWQDAKFLSDYLKASKDERKKAIKDIEQKIETKWNTKKGACFQSINEAILNILIVELEIKKYGITYHDIIDCLEKTGLEYDKITKSPLDLTQTALLSDHTKTVLYPESDDRKIKKDIVEIIIANPQLLSYEGGVRSDLANILDVTAIDGTFHEETMKLFLNDNSKFEKVIKYLQDCKEGNFTSKPKNLDLYPEEKGYNVAKWTRGVAFKRIEGMKDELTKTAPVIRPTVIGLPGGEYKGK